MNPLTNKPQFGYLQEINRILEIFRLNWKTYLGIHLVISVFSVLVLTPLLTMILGWLVLASGQTALTDEDILFFALSPTGLPIVLLAAALYTTVAVFEQAAMITSSRHIALGQTVSLPNLGRFLLMKFWPLFRLALQLIGRTALIALPFLAVSALVFYAFLTEYDINYYLSAKPAVFWWAGGVILVCLLTMAGVLLRTFSGWVLALPLLLLNDENPARVLSSSREASKAMRFPIALILLTLFLLNAGILGLLSLLADFAMDGAIAFANDSLRILAYLLGSLAIIWLISTLAIAFFGNSVLALVIIAMFTRLAKTTDDGYLEQGQAQMRSGRAWNISATRLAGLALIISLASGFAVYLSINKLNFEENTMIIAHRGASADAPENTLAALELAINQGADWVEIDVQETRQGEVMVIHDSDLKKIGGSPLKVFEAPLSELQSVDIGSWMNPSFSDQRVPTLQQVLALCKDRINIVIELKYYGQEKQFEERVVRLVETADMQDQIVVMSLSYPGVQKMKSIRPQWKVGLLSSVSMGDITRLNADFFAVNAKFASRKFIKRIHKQKRQVMVWTVNDPVSISAMISKGADGIITDYPGLAVKIRQERAELDIHERMMIQLASYFGKQPARPEQ